MSRTGKKSMNRRLRKLVMVTSLSAIILAVSTYAWFIGTQTVNVSSFDVEIAAVDGLALSLNGETFTETVIINSENFSTQYTGNTNTWSKGGLIPVSSVGEIDTATSRLKLFEKSSLTATRGGYRIMSDPVPNSGAEEAKGYVAFDLFVRNQSGTEYFDTVDLLNEEAIYLTNDSDVTVASNGTKNTGIENSVRLAFAQIGRVRANGNSTAETIQSIACDSTEDEISTICSNRRATIWEPNDTKHVTNAISYYDKSCRARTGTDVTVASAYSDTASSCTPVVDGLYSHTYAINAGIDHTDNVDVYDGEAYNTYADTTLLEYPTNNIITDSMKFREGNERPEFIRLAPNSITKVRVYVYIEGQDVDNYDLASIGKAISVKFGFTKQRYTEGDINYDGPAVNKGTGPAVDNDKTAPVIVFGGSVTTTATKDSPFDYEAGVSAYDRNGEGLSTDVTTFAVAPTTPAANTIIYEETVNTAIPGNYIVVYKVYDAAGNLGTKLRTVTVTE